jgi:glycosyltransferase involved in cell wall biosynthesis
LVKKIRELDPKVVFSTFGYINVFLSSIRWLLPQKIEIWAREANLPSISLLNNPQSRLMAALYRIFYKRVDRLICSSERMKNEFISNFSVPKNITCVLFNPVDLDTIQFKAFPVRRFDKGGVCYVAAGRLTFQKGFERLLYWFSEIDDKMATLVILGDGDLKGELIKKSKALNLQGRVRFIGFCNNPWRWYAGADVFLLSSRWEGMPNSVLESLACGTPVIATEDSGGIREISSQGEGGNVVITAEGRGFIKAMNEASNKNGDHKFRSMLPEEYKIKNVVSVIETWIKS